MPGERQHQLYRWVEVQTVEVGDILLEPCYDGDCDGPWHESRVDVAKRDAHNVYLTADREDDSSVIWLCEYGDRIHVLPRLRRSY